MLPAGFISDAFNLSCLLHIFGQLEILGVRFRKLTHTKNSRFTAKVKKLVDRYCLLRDILEQFKGRYNGMIVVHYLEGMLAACLCGKDLAYVSSALFI